MAPFDLRSATRLISRIRQAGASLRTHARTHGTARHARMDGWREAKTRERRKKTTSVRGSVCSKRSGGRSLLSRLVCLSCWAWEKNAQQANYRSLFLSLIAHMREAAEPVFYVNKASFGSQLALNYKNRYFPPLNIALVYSTLYIRNSPNFTKWKLRRTIDQRLNC